MANEAEQIKTRLDIVEVIGEYVHLKQSGANWKGLCPFHGEKTPSFMVHREKQIWRCFGCGEGGDLFTFIQKIENLEFPEALELLARRAGIELTRANPAEQSRKVRLLNLVDEAAAYYREQLAKSPAAKARAYVAERVITPESVATFGLGYAPPEWDKLLVAMRAKGYTPDELVAAGLILKSERGPGWYDRFRDRLLFPIADAQGRTVGFGGRTLDPLAKEAKYINSPQTALYNKSLVLYNLDRAKHAINEAGYAVLVEGYMDVVGSWQAGTKNVVSVSGTALTLDQVHLLKRYTNDIRIAFDADLAGRSASERGIDLALAAELEVKVIVVPQGKDPDECARQNPEAWRQAVVAALPIVDYAFQLARQELDFATREGKKEAAKRLLTAIAKLPDPVERDYYLKRLAQELGVEERSLRERLAAAPPRMSSADTVQPAGSQAAAVPSRSRHELVLENLLALLVKFPDELGELSQNLDPTVLGTSQLAQLYRRMLVYYTEQHRLSLDELMQELKPEAELAQLVDTLVLLVGHQYTDISAPEAHHEVRQLVADLTAQFLRAELKTVTMAIAEAERAGRPPEQALLERFNELTRELTKLN